MSCAGPGQLDLIFGIVAIIFYTAKQIGGNDLNSFVVPTQRFSIENRFPIGFKLVDRAGQ